MKAGLNLIYEHSYQAFTLRQLAEKVGLKVGSLYNYIESKHDLLARLVLAHLEDLLASAARAIPEDGDPIEGIVAFVRFHLNYHIDKKKEVSIGSSELRSLEPRTYRRVVAMRRDYEQILVRLLDRAQGARLISPTDTQVAAYAILAMLTGICSWYSPKGRLTKEDLLQVHTNLVLKGLGVAGRAVTVPVRTASAAEALPPARTPRRVRR
jgi:AcrR family transcriptional regulator